MSGNHQGGEWTKNPWQMVAGLIAAVVGWQLAQYAAFFFVVPGFVSLVLFGLFVKTPVGPRLFRGAIALTIGHVAWFILAGVMGAPWSAVLPDVVLLAGATALLWLRPSRASAVVLGVIQLGSLSYNLIRLFGVSVGAAEHRGLLVAVVFRMIVLLALAFGWRGLASAPSSAAHAAPARRKRKRRAPSNG